METYSYWVQLVIKVLAVVLFAALLSLAILGVFKVARAPGGKMLAYLASVFLSQEQIVVNPLPSPLPSGESFSLGWNHEGKRGDGSYELRYPCAEGFTLKLSSGEAIPCNSGFPLAGGSNSASLIPVLTGTDPLSVPLAVGFIPSGALEPDLSGMTSIVVIASTSTNTVAPHESKKVTPPVFSGTAPAPQYIESSPPAQVYSLGDCQNKLLANGVPDLAVKIFAVGIVDGQAGNFTATTSVAQGQYAGVVFDVTNVGTAISNKWRFSATLPTYESYFASPLEDSLSPCSSIRFTLGFRGLNDHGANTVTITVDPQNELKDANRANDTATTTIYRAF